jgi:hypothetical protein
MEEVVQPLLQTFLGQIDSAMKVSEVLSNHEEPSSEEPSSEEPVSEEPREITVDHVIAGLVYRLMVPMTNDEVTQSLANAQRILVSLDESSSEEEDYEPIILDENIEFGSRKVTVSRCTCDICSQARRCLVQYHNHDCADPLADKFKAAIDETCEKHKIYI